MTVKGQRVHHNPRLRDQYDWAMPKESTNTGIAAPGADLVNAYLAGVEARQRQTLEALRASIKKIIPYAEEGMKYAMPAFILDGKGVAGYAAFTGHCSYFPMSGSVLESAGDLVANYKISKGGLRFATDGRLPVGLLRKLIKLRMEEIAAVENGRRCEYYPDGRLKAAGQMRDGKLHGQWKWYRYDGTLMRTGEFTFGEQTGTWTTFERDGSEGRTTIL